MNTDKILKVVSAITMLMEALSDEPVTPTRKKRRSKKSRRSAKKKIKKAKKKIKKKAKR